MELSIKLYLYLCVPLVAGIIALHSFPRMGKLGKSITEFLCYAPGIDLALAYYMLLPVIVGSIVSGWIGVGIAILAELSVLWAWIFAHEFAHRDVEHQRSYFSHLE